MRCWKDPNLFLSWNYKTRSSWHGSCHVGILSACSSSWHLSRQNKSNTITNYYTKWSSFSEDEDARRRRPIKGRGAERASERQKDEEELRKYNLILELLQSNWRRKWWNHLRIVDNRSLEFAAFIILATIQRTSNPVDLSITLGRMPKNESIESQIPLSGRRSPFPPTSEARSENWTKRYFSVFSFEIFIVESRINSNQYNHLSILLASRIPQL